jgi:excisionase family DNA binding protein
MFLSPKELSTKLNVPVNTIYYWVSKDEIPYIKMGKHNRFDYQAVLDFFKDKTQSSRGRNES